MSENGLSCIDPRMTVLDIVSRHRETEAVFKAWGSRAGECICCRALFHSVQHVADRYGLDLDRLMAELNAVVGEPGGPLVSDPIHDPIDPLSGRKKMAENNTSAKPLRLTETVRGAG